MMPEPPKPDQPSKPTIPMPMVSVGEGQMDIYSRLAKDRILLLGTDVNDEVANNLVAQMLFLANEDPGKDITMYSKYPFTSITSLSAGNRGGRQFCAAYEGGAHARSARSVFS